jgi:hypothetical protein
LFATLDGREIGGLTSYQGDSPSFEVTYTSEEPSWQYDPASGTDCLLPWAEGNVCGVEVGKPKLVHGIGYWLMLEPLAPGPHVLHFRGGFEAIQFSTDVTYVLNVAGPAGGQ